MRPLLLAMLLGMLLHSPAVSSSVTAPHSSTLTHTALLEPAQHTLDLIYNMEFDAALEATEGLIKLAPAHPAGYFYRAAVYWQWRLIAYDSQQRAVLLRQFQDATQRTREVAAHLPPAQVAEAAFYLGAVYGMQARMHFVEQQYVRALLAAKQGSAYLQQCVAHVPDWYDAYAGLGTYYYVLSRVPGFWRGIVQRLVGLDGDRDRGLQALEQAHAHGRLSVPEAASLLAKIYTLPDEQQYDRAYVLLDRLVQRYPYNIDYRYRLMLVCVHLGRWERARQLSHSLIAEITHHRPSLAHQWLPLLRYRLAETHLFAREPQAAAALLGALQGQDLSAPLRAWVELRLGNVHDLQGERQAAQAWYRGVQGDAAAATLARAYMTTPFTPALVYAKPLEQAVI